MKMETIEAQLGKIVVVQGKGFKKEKRGIRKITITRAHAHEFQKLEGRRQNSKAQRHDMRFQNLEGRMQNFENTRAKNKISKHLRVKSFKDQRVKNIKLTSHDERKNTQMHNTISRPMPH